MIIFFWMKKKKWKKCLITKSIFLSWKFGENGVTRKWNVKYKDSNVWFETLYIIYIIRNWNDFEIQNTTPDRIYYNIYEICNFEVKRSNYFYCVCNNMDRLHTMPSKQLIFWTSFRLGNILCATFYVYEIAIFNKKFMKV